MTHRLVAALTLVGTLAAAGSLAGQGPPEDHGTLTRVRVVVDSLTFDDVRASRFLPEAFPNVADDVAGEVALCGRFACLVFAQATPTDPVGSIVLGVRAATGKALVVPAADSLPAGVVLADVAPPPPPDIMTDPDSLGIIYDLTEAHLALPPDALPPIVRALEQAGIEVAQEGNAAAIIFGAATVRLLPAWDVPGLHRAGFLLRREAGGDPTYRFGARSTLRFGPGRQASWSF